MSSWKITGFAPRDAVHAALVAHEAAPDWDEEIVLTGCEIEEQKPMEWRLDAYLPRKPTAADRRAITALFDDAPELAVEHLPEDDWVTLSQQGVEPISAGRFFVHTPEYAPSEKPGKISFAIPASQAFGTGHHRTTAGCLEMLDLMKREGLVIRNLADIGTGTGLLAFAGLRLWPRALATASDIDDVCMGVVEDNAAANGVPMGSGAGQLAMTIAAGMDSPVLQSRAPYDLLIANILAGPLVELAPDFGKAVVPGGHLLLAGLLETQEPAVRRAAFRAGFRLARRAVRGDWSILWLRKRATR